MSKKIEELKEVLRQGQHNADTVQLPSESQDNARYLENKAIELVEEITGEKWYFPYWYFG